MRGFSVTIAAAALAVLAFGYTTGAAAQQATERYIPIGQSPGISNRVTVIGRIYSADPGTRTLLVDGGRAPRSVKIEDRTDIWLDRSKQGQPSVRAGMADLKPGNLVEVMFSDTAGTLARWIKIEATN